MFLYTHYLNFIWRWYRISNINFYNFDCKECAYFPFDCPECCCLFLYIRTNTNSTSGVTYDCVEKFLISIGMQCILEVPFSDVLLYGHVGRIMLGGGLFSEGVFWADTYTFLILPSLTTYLKLFCLIILFRWS